MIVLSIEGNIGAGKTTLLNKLKEIHSEFNYVPEPVDTWMKIKDDNGNHIIKQYYSDIGRWAYTFQNFAFISRHMIMDESIKNKKESDVFITERCVFTDKNVFAQMLKEDNLMSELEFKIYDFWFDSLSKNNNVDAYIYVTTDVDLSEKRIKIRNREGETIQHDYLERLDSYHHKWLSNETKPVLLFDTEKDSIDKVINFINGLKANK